MTNKILMKTLEKLQMVAVPELGVGTHNIIKRVWEMLLFC